MLYRESSYLVRSPLADVLGRNVMVVRHVERREKWVMEAKQNLARRDEQSW
jgi:hypothetical protein